MMGTEKEESEMKKRCLALFLTVMLVVSMVGTARADVMNGISVDGTYFEMGGGNQSGDGWSWDDGNRILCLDGFYSSDLAFYNCDDVALILIGENQLFSTSSQGLWVEGTGLTLQGDGKLTAPFLAAIESDVTVAGGTLYLTGSDQENSNGAGIYGVFSDFVFSGGTVFAGGKKYGMRLELFSTLSVTGNSFAELYGPEAALVKQELYTPEGTASFSEIVALLGLPGDASILGGNEANDRNALHFAAVGDVKDGEVGSVVALTAGSITAEDVFADAPGISGAAKRAYLEGTGGMTATEFLPAPSELTWGKVYDLETAELADCPAGLGWKVYGDTDGMFHISLYNENGEGYLLEYLSLDGNDLGVKDGRYYMTLDLALELFLSAPRGEHYTIEVTNASAANGVGDSEAATATISDEIVTAWLTELGFERDAAGEYGYDEEDATIPKEWRAYERWMEIVLDDSVVSFTAYALKDPATGYETNFVRVRDIAFWLDGTAATFDVSWDGAVNLRPGQSYNMDGTELGTPFGGTRRYEFSTAQTKVNGAAKEMQAILLKDDDGNGYTYYKLRDLGNALGFGVEWDSENAMVVVRTE